MTSIFYIRKAKKNLIPRALHNGTSVLLQLLQKIQKLKLSVN